MPWTPVLPALEEGQTLTAAKADKYELYSAAVQDVVQLAEDIRQIARDRGARARTLLEDFSGSAQLSAAWVASDPKAIALAVDSDDEPLQWFRQRVAPTLDPAAAERVHIRRGDAREPLEMPGGGPDIIYAGNFSWMIFKTRPELTRYLRRSFDLLPPGGLLLLDHLVGPLAVISAQADADRAVERTHFTWDHEHTDVAQHIAYTFVWEQRSHNFLTGEAQNHIHFEFPDGAELRSAFEYTWRYWGMAEVIELLREIGFEVEVLWSLVDAEGEELGRYGPLPRGEVIADHCDCIIVATRPA